MKFERICLSCGKRLIYKNEITYNHAIKANSICKSCAGKEKLKEKHCANLSNLLLDTPEAFYWMGFLLADGCFCNNRLVLTLSIKDSNHLYKFAKFINYTGMIRVTDKSISIAYKDIDTVSKIKEKFDIKDKKTYNPPNTILKFNIDLTYALLAGFIDGDGSIKNQFNRKDFYLTIKNHSSWISILKEFNNMISDKNLTRLNSSGYANLVISNTEDLKKLKIKILSLNIPILTRKWDIINLNYTSKYVIASRLREKVLLAYKAGIRNKDISKKFNTSTSNITKIIKIYGKYI